MTATKLALLLGIFNLLCFGIGESERFFVFAMVLVQWLPSQDSWKAILSYISVRGRVNS